MTGRVNGLHGDVTQSQRVAIVEAFGLEAVLPVVAALS